jgi:hypothetical protein
VALRPLGCSIRHSLRPSITATAMTTTAMYPNNDTLEASGSGCLSTRTSIMLEEEIKLHRFAGISPEQSFTEAGRHREAVVAAD